MQNQPKLAKWPFIVGDLVLLGIAAVVIYRGPIPLAFWQAALCFCAVAAAACVGVWPFILEYRSALKLAEADRLAETVSQIKKLEAVGAQMNTATASWQIAQESSSKTVQVAKEIAERMNAEAQAFTEFLAKANDSERAHLKLEIEKLRRAESDWLQVVVRILDHVFALNQAAIRSGQPNVIEQLGAFQNACRDVTRRIGLVPFAAAADEPFDGQRHQLVDSKDAPPADARIAETIAAGYTFQGQMLRPALVALQSNGAAEKKPAAQTERTVEKQEEPTLL